MGVEVFFDGGALSGCGVFVGVSPWGALGVWGVLDVWGALSEMVLDVISACLGWPPWTGGVSSLSPPTVVGLSGGFPFVMMTLYDAVAVIVSAFGLYGNLLCIQSTPAGPIPQRNHSVDSGKRAI